MCITDRKIYIDWAAAADSAVLVERMWTMLEEEKTKVGGSCPLGIIVQANDLSF